MAISDATTSLPYFAANQVLRASDLNRLVEMMETESRLSRVFTIGIGIFSGLRVIVNKDDFDQIISITITSGIGISSDGYLFQLQQDCEFTHYDPTSISRNAFRCPSGGLGCEDDTDTMTVGELKTEEEANFSIDDFPKLPAESTNDLYEDKCIVLLRCRTRTERKSCFNECEEKGADQFVSIRPLIVDRTELMNLIGEASDDDSNGVQIELSAKPYIRRFGYGVEATGENQPVSGINLCGVETWQIFYENFYSLIREVIPTSDGGQTSILVKAYEEARDKYGAPGDFSTLAEDLRAVVARYPEPFSINQEVVLEVEDIQYLHDYIKDLVLAYWEFEKVVCGLARVGGGDTEISECWFPGFVALGELIIEPTQGNGDGSCRTEFISPKVQAGNQDRIILADCLYARMKALVNTNHVRIPTIPYLNNEVIKITPSPSKTPWLSRRAIPFYYNTDALRSTWWCLPCGDSSQRIPSYYPGGLANTPPFDLHLYYDLDAFEFFRVEGHVNRELGAVIGQLDFERKKFNLPFDIVHVNLGPKLIEDDKKSYYFSDLENLYEKIRGDIVCKLEEMLLAGTELSGQVVALKGLLQGAYRDLCVLGDGSIYEDDFLPRLNEVLVTFDENGNPSPSPFNECCQAALEELVEDFRERKAEVEKQMSFHGFAELHPGMEHRAGVMKGGTLVLVCVDMISPEVLSFLGNIDDLSLDQIRSIIQDLNLPAGTREPVKKMIVADFCLPYYCCSKAPVIRNEIKRVKVSISLGEVEFCSNDDSEYPITGFPAGGDFTADPDEGLGTNSDGIDVFKPSDVGTFEDGRAEILLSYSLDGESAELLVTVYEAPNLNDVDILCENEQPICGNPELNEDPNCVVGYQYDLRFDNLPAEAYEYFEWRRADGIVIGTENPQPKFEVRFAESPVEVVLFVRNGICEGETQPKTIAPCPDIDDIEISLIQLLGNKEENPLENFDGELIEIPATEIPTHIRIEPSIAGGKLTAIRRFDNGTEEDRPVSQQGCPDTVYQFDLNERPEVGGAESITYELTYQFQGCEGSKVFTIRVVLGQIVIPDEICQSDENIPLSAIPAGGSFDMSPDYIGGTADAPVFISSAITDFTNGETTVGITYTPSEGDAITKDVKVYQETKARFNAGSSGPSPVYGANCEFNGLIYRLTNGSEGYNMLNWNIPTGMEILNGTVNSEAIDLHVPPGVGGDVTLLADNTANQCPSDTSAPLRFTGCPEKITFEIDGNAFDPAEGNSLPVAADTVVPTPVVIKPIPNGGALTVVRTVRFTNGDSDTTPITNIEVIQGATCAETTHSVPIVNLEGTDIESVEYEITYDLNICGLVSFTIIPGPLGLRSASASAGSEEGSSAEPIARSVIDSPTPPPPPDANTLLNQRQDAYRTAVEDQGKDASLARTKSYKLAELFLAFRGEEEALNARYEEAMSTLANSAKRASGERRAQYHSLIAAVTHSYLDKLVADTGETISEGARAIIKAQVDKMKEADLKMSQLKRNWKGSELKKALDTKAVDQINRLLK